MKTLKILIVDDEPLAHKVLETYCSNIDFLEIIGHCYDGISTINFLHKTQVDAIFLDIQMPDITGLELLDSLQDQSPKVILTTAFADFALESFEYDAVIDFLHKPIRLKRFLKSIERLKKLDKLEHEYHGKKIITAASTEKKASEFISLKDNKTIYRVLLSEIIYVQSWGNYLKFFLQSGEMKVIRKTIKLMEDELPKSQFQRIHKSYIVNLRYVEAIEGNLVLINKEKLAMGKSYAIETKKAITGIR